MVRLFAAIELPVQIRRQLELICGGIPGARWTPTERMHLTLRFIGEVDNTASPDVHGALARVSFDPFEVQLRGIGQFGGRLPRVLWIGVTPNPALSHLHDRINAELAKAGHPTDSGNYVPHVTLARLNRAPRGRVGAFIAAHNMAALPSFTVDEFALMSSRLYPTGPVYQTECIYPSAPDSAAAASNAAIAASERPK